MLKLTKSVSAENYPLSPQTSSVRKLTINVQPSNPVDLGKSYLLVKNKLSTTIRGQAVVRNVGWGTQLTEDKTVMFPDTCQIRTASLYLDGQLVEYCEDVNVRLVNMCGYEKTVDELRKWANVGKYGFQRVEGPKISALDGNLTPFMDGAYLSPMLERPVDENGKMLAARYKEVPSVIHLSDIFGFCAAAGQVNLSGRQVKIELQFEDRFELLAEVINYPANCSGAAPTTRNDMVFPVDPTSLLDLTVSPAAFPAAASAGPFSLQSPSIYNSVSEVPFYVGQPICLWISNAAPAVAASNYAVITGISLSQNALTYGAAIISFQQYNVNRVLATGGAAITAAQFFANLAAGAPLAGVCVGITGVYDPALTANDTLQFFTPAAAGPPIVPPIILGAGIASTYQITGIEAVMCEIVGQEVGKKEVDYIQYSRDMDTIAAGQLYYQKSFMLDPACSAVLAVAPCAKITGQGNRNMWAVSEQAGVSSGVSFRNMMNGQQLYSRDIVFSNATQNVEPLHLDRLEMAMEALGGSLKNTSTTTQLVVQNGTGQHVLIAERVPMSGSEQQFQVRLVHNQNSDARTIYVFKAIVKSATV